MYQIDISAKKVESTLKKHMLADGLDLTFDMEKSEGVYIYDTKHDRKLLDFFTCFASVPLGYNHPKMINDENFKHHLLLAALANPSNSDVYTQQYAQFVATFSKIAMPSYMHHAFFIAGGTLAIENAIKTAMDWKVQKNFAKGHQQEKGFKVIHFEKAFHGRSGYTLSLTNTSPDKTKWYAKFDWPRVSTPIIQFPIAENLKKIELAEQKSIDEIKEAFKDNKDDICAIIIEPIQSEGGDNHIREEFLIQLKQLADENEAFLIYDEVQTGVGLTGKFWCHQHFSEKARPDIIAFGKKMQVCGIIAGSKVDEIDTNVFRVPSRINSTWGGNLVDMVRSTQILNIIEEDRLIDNVDDVGGYLLHHLQLLSKEFTKMSNVRGRGLFCAFDFPDKATRDLFIKQGLANHVMFLGCGERTIRFRPALCMQKEHIDIGIKVMAKILASI